MQGMGQRKCSRPRQLLKDCWLWGDNVPVVTLGWSGVSYLQRTPNPIWLSNDLVVSLLMQSGERLPCENACPGVLRLELVTSWTSQHFSDKNWLLDKMDIWGGGSSGLVKTGTMFAFQQLEMGSFHFSSFQLFWRKPQNFKEKSLPALVATAAYHADHNILWFPGASPSVLACVCKTGGYVYTSIQGVIAARVDMPELPLI